MLSCETNLLCLHSTTFQKKKNVLVIINKITIILQDIVQVMLNWYNSIGRWSMT